MIRSALVLLGALAALAAGGAPAGAQLYRWVDRDGVTRYTNDLSTVPPALRARVQDIGSPRPRAAEPPPAAEEPGASSGAVLPFRGGSAIRVTAHLNGVPLTLLVDTGADRTVLSPAAAGRAGLDAAQGGVVRIVGVAGSAEAREVVVERLDVAGAAIGPLAIVVHDVRLPEVDGLLGRDVLDAFTLTLDGAHGRAILTPR